MAGLAFLGAIIGIPALLALSSIFNGYALKILWGWFIVPVFHLPFLNIPQAIGMAMVVGYLTIQVDEYKDKEKNRWREVWWTGRTSLLQTSVRTVRRLDRPEVHVVSYDKTGGVKPASFSISPSLEYY